MVSAECRTRLAYCEGWAAAAQQSNLRKPASPPTCWASMRSGCTERMMPVPSVGQLRPYATCGRVAREGELSCRQQSAACTARRGATHDFAAHLEGHGGLPTVEEHGCRDAQRAGAQQQVLRRELAHRCRRCGCRWQRRARRRSDRRHWRGGHLRVVWLMLRRSERQRRDASRERSGGSDQRREACGVLQPGAGVSVRRALSWRRRRVCRFL